MSLRSTGSAGVELSSCTTTRCADEPPCPACELSRAARRACAAAGAGAPAEAAAGAADSGLDVAPLVGGTSLSAGGLPPLTPELAGAPSPLVGIWVLSRPSMVAGL